jgi:ribonuclease Y
MTGAKVEANKIIEDAKSEAKTLRKESLLEAKEEQHKLRSEFEKESKERRAEMTKSEQRLQQREDAVDKKEALIDKRQDTLDTVKKQLDLREVDINKKDNEVKEAHNKMLAELEKVAGLSKEDAKKQLMDELIDVAKRDAGVLAKQIEQEAKEEAEKKAKNIVSLAIQRCATDHAAEITVSVVALPNEEMKGRIIGRVGRNIRALENSTGVDLIIDDTPDVVTISGFDPVRREIARITLEKLVADGRIHPARIEEMVEKVKKDIDNQIKEAGESAVYDTGLYGIHPELVKLLGRLKYRTSYGQNVLKHSLEVSYLAGMMAAELGADVKLAKRGGLLHDLGKAVDHEVEGTHVQIGVELAKKYKESKEVIHCIEAHHGDVEPQSIEAILVQAADGISGGRPGARRESLENYIKRLEKLEGVANSFAGVEQSYAIQAGREIRVIVKPDVVDDAGSIFMAKEIAKKLESELEYPGQIKVNVIREMRSVEYAK